MVFYKFFGFCNYFSFCTMEFFSNRCLYCHRKFGPLSKTRLWYNIRLLERSIQWRNENEETSRPSLNWKVQSLHACLAYKVATDNGTFYNFFLIPKLLIAFFVNSV